MVHVLGGRCSWLYYLQLKVAHLDSSQAPLIRCTDEAVVPMCCCTGSFNRTPFFSIFTLPVREMIRTKLAPFSVCAAAVGEKNGFGSWQKTRREGGRPRLGLTQWKEVVCFHCRAQKQGGLRNSLCVIGISLLCL